MSESDLDIRSLLAIAEAIVDESEVIFADGLGADPARLKQAGDFATEVDIEIEAQLKERLTELTGIPVFGEESGGDADADTLWVVDPIDGTANYAAGNPMCAILVSLLHAGQPRLAITSMPLLGRRLCAYEGSPLYVNGRAQPSLKESGDMVAQVGFSSVGAQHDSNFPGMLRRGLLAELAETFLRPRITGSVGVDLGFTAQGIFGGAVSFSPHVWDNAAGVLLLRSAGAVVTDIKGRPWRPSCTGVVAGNPRAHRTIMRTMDALMSSR